VKNLYAENFKILIKKIEDEKKYTPIITVNESNDVTKRHRLAEWIPKIGFITQKIIF